MDRTARETCGPKLYGLAVVRHVQRHKSCIVNHATPRVNANSRGFAESGFRTVQAGYP